MRLRRAALALVVLCAVGCAGPRRFELPALDGWHAVDANGVRILAGASPEDTRELARELAGFDAAFAFLIGRQIAATGPTAIALIRDRELKGRFGLGRGV